MDGRFALRPFFMRSEQLRREHTQAVREPQGLNLHDSRLAGSTSRRHGGLLLVRTTGYAVCSFSVRRAEREALKFARQSDTKRSRIEFPCEGRLNAPVGEALD